MGNGQPIPPPPIPKTISLLHMEGADTGTVFTDDNSSYTWVASGTTTSTDQAKFGSTSMKCVPNNSPRLTSDQIINLAGDWTIEGFVYPLTTGTTRGLFLSLGVELQIFINGSGYIVVQNPANEQYYGTGAPSANQWSHIAVVKTGSHTVSTFLNGVKQTTFSDSLTGFADPNNRFRVSDNIGNFFSGYIDEFRISNVARYSSNFTPTASPFVLD